MGQKWRGLSSLCAGSEKSVNDWPGHGRWGPVMAAESTAQSGDAPLLCLSPVLGLSSGCKPR